MHHFKYKRVDDIPRHIDSCIDQLNVVESTTRYNKWKTYDFRKKVRKVAKKLNDIS